MSIRMCEMVFKLVSDINITYLLFIYIRKY